MQLGDWVAFDTIVVRQPTATGSRPQAQPLGRARYGIVIGVRPVYETTAGNPPQLSNRQTVLLVATSLHTCYRVFVGDARPCAGPPAPRARGRRRQKRAAGAAGASSDGGAAMDLNPISQGDLAVLVADEIGRRLSRQEWFTAYDITQALRAAHASDLILHADVRSAVHAQMEAAVASGLYERETASYSSGSAVRYMPG